MMMVFYVKRLNLDPKSGLRYHLFDGKGIILLVTDPGEGEQEKIYRQVRLSRPDGKVVAMLEMGKGDPTPKGLDYAIVYDDAVYAVIGKRSRPEHPPYFILEAEQEKWLILPRPGFAQSYLIFDHVPAGFGRYRQDIELDNEQAIGQISLTGGDYHYHINLNNRRLHQSPLVILTLIFLINE